MILAKNTEEQQKAVANSEGNDRLCTDLEAYEWTNVTFSVKKMVHVRCNASHKSCCAQN